MLRDRLVDAPEAPVAESELEQVHVAQSRIEARQPLQDRDRLLRMTEQDERRREPQAQVHAARCTFDCAARGGDGCSAIPAHSLREAESLERIRIVWIQLERALRVGAGALERPLVLDPEKVEQALAARERRPALREVGVERDAARELLPGRQRAVEGVEVDLRAPLHEQRPYLGPHRVLARHVLELSPERTPELRDDAPHDLVLQCKDVAKLAVVALGPELVSRFSRPLSRALMRTRAPPRRTLPSTTWRTPSSRPSSRASTFFPL